MALALKKYTLVPTAEGTLDPRYPDGNTAPTAPVLGAVTVVSAIQLDIALATPSTGGTPPLIYVLERSITSASTGFSIIFFNAFSAAEPVYHDSNLDPDTQYWYRTYSLDSNTVQRQSDNSNVVTGVTDVAPSSDITPPSVPLGLASPSHTTTTITLTWSASTDF